ncbi:hypothetical protein H4S02_000958 [Coemansia sp. RSA 2611]|nr:hypothetical protein H4S02_000958 [Coemansia sp. RSA 2611]
MDSELDVYALLEISADAGEKEVTRAYRAKALQHHPDKNRDNPDAARIFHDIKAAYDLLLDAPRRAAYDERRRAQLAKRQRQSALSGQRKRMKSQLERDEQAARNRHAEQAARDQHMRAEAARFRDEAARDAGRRDRQMREHVRRADAERAQEAAEAAAASEADELDRSVRVRWDPELSHSRESLARVFSCFGELEEVVVAPVSDAARRRGHSQPASALLVFRSLAAAHALMNVPHEDALTQGFERFWARGAEPQAARDIAETLARASRIDGKAPPAAGRKSGRIPDISAIDLRQIPGSNLAFADFESLTLMRMRQRGAAAEQNV